MPPALEMTQGYLTIATGPRQYLEMAVDLALSIRAFDDRPVALACDEENARVASTEFAGLFSDLLVIPEEFRRFHWGTKFSIGELSVFEETVYMDADCLVVSDPDTLWQYASSQPITLTGEYLDYGAVRNHGGFDVTFLMERFKIRRYIKNNGGIIHFRKGVSRQWFRDCFHCYEHEIVPALWDGVRPVHSVLDELAFAVVGARRGFGVYDTPVPQYWHHEIAGINLLRPTKPVLHLTGPVPRRVLDPLMRQVADRRRAAGLSPADSEQFWRRKAAGPGLRRVIRRVAFRVLSRLGVISSVAGKRK